MQTNGHSIVAPPTEQSRVQGMQDQIPFVSLNPHSGCVPSETPVRKKNPAGELRRNHHELPRLPAAPYPEALPVTTVCLKVSLGLRAEYRALKFCLIRSDKSGFRSAEQESRT